MTIKEVEQILNIPRATIRYYEKEKLIDPHRIENGYRDYSNEDVELLKKIIILRKIGLSVNSIEELFDGAKTMSEALGENIINLQKQIEELKGAMFLSQKMKNDSVEIDSFVSDIYWNIIDEEEKNGNSFMDIAKDIAKEEKKVIFSYLGMTDRDGNLYNIPWSICSFIIMIIAIGVTCCLIEQKWNLKNFLFGLISVFCFILIDLIVSIPIYFLGKRFPCVAKNRVIITALLFSVSLLIAANTLGI